MRRGQMQVRCWLLERDAAARGAAAWSSDQELLGVWLYAFASVETHLPNAFALPPYFALKGAAPIVFSSLLHV